MAQGYGFNTGTERLVFPLAPVIYLKVCLCIQSEFSMVTALQNWASLGPSCVIFFLKLHDIWHKFSCMYISVHNGVIELLHDLVVVWAGGMGLPLEQIDSYSLLHQ